ncbi:TetR/AcrR family transcriptional regulator [Halomonas sp. MCCC 1A17488]|uniref:TetR/AcrR family transcriptional regulator n=1 Tax=unclassified Halomonas TaxID=2609666 RepID=UPI0018D221B5|nr:MULTISPECIES: TetR/AcrR family transcriptional regulator [unclassified Halomonas]MCE8017716.1 TetR/AcrR family transcriptional regulator [Halomonas sp. MCCC 1A17488]MCG3241049.1 TetR/AcrR family transcriptional regulator [Halomonas sp. MCCC 1A17488]QPP48912.1 TetR/AcrR family transcriptional regulator [Halomonas sp. SS10-MC5]
MPASKRDQLLATAERLFYEQGFHATGIDRIVAAAGVVRMTLYNHFSSKEALVAAVLKARHERFIASLDAATAAAPPGQATRALVEAHGRWLDTYSQHGCIMTKAMGEFAEHSAEIHTLARTAKRDLLTRLEAAVARDGLGHHPNLARHLFLVLEGCNTAVLLLGMRRALADTRAVVDALLAAARSHDQ